MLKSRDNKRSESKIIPLKDCLAKTILGNKPGVSVETHCLIVGYVARELINRMPVWLRKELFPKGSELIAAAHDMGKVSPTFQDKIYEDIGIKKNLINCKDKDIGYHWTVSQAAVKQCPRYIPEILGRHHGGVPQIVNAPDAEVYGGQNWQKQRLDLLSVLKKDLNAEWPAVTSALHSDVLTGLTVVADWIGSGPLFDMAERSGWKNKISKALDRAGFVTPKIRKKLMFENIFHFAPRDAQTRLSAAIDNGVYVLEAPMGSGKTEAALYAAYKILEENRATGIYFALPTQLTSDKVYERMKKFLEKILDEPDRNHRSLLLHSAAWLRDTELGEDGAPGHAWFNSAKRGLLAPFAVGTIDQALMAVMNVKHGFVRTFGLAGKVVILDEVHSYDSYTGTILKELVVALRQLHCTVIILSATLTDKQRHSIMGINGDDGKNKGQSAYPLISAYSNARLIEMATAKPEDAVVDICIVQNDSDAVEEALRRAERKEQILWIENTVDEAQARYCHLAARASAINVECGLVHSRFIKADRERNENKWVGVFGKAGRNVRQEKGRILVGTQVLEQSLDIDADFMVTRLCPTDMLFQRIGRLWRHRENESIRPSEAKQEAWILVPRLDEALENKKSFGKSAYVYSPYVLCRTLEVWQDLLRISVPREIRPLLERTYAERKEENIMAKYKQEMEEKRDALRRLALAGISIGGKTLPESRAVTRYSETESAEVLLIRKKAPIKNGVRVEFLDGSVIDLPKFTNVVERRKIAAELLRNTVMVPEYRAPQATTKQLIWLKDYVYLGNNEESPFRVAVVAESGELLGIDNTDISEKYNSSYDSCLGYRAIKKEGGCNADCE